MSATPSDHADAADRQDPVAAKRARVAAASALGKRIGYLLYGLAIVLFFVGFGLGYRVWMTTTIVALMAVGAVLLIPSIIFAYGVKAADREDRGESSHY